MKLSRDIIQLGRSFVLSLGGEGLQSGFHFALNLLMIRMLSTHDFGVFAIAFVLGGISLYFGNALVSIPAAVHLARIRSPGAFHYQDVVYGSIALIASAGIAVVVATGLWLTVGEVDKALIAGAFAGCWTLRNHVRTVLFARHAVIAATRSDFSYTVTGATLIACALLLFPDVPRVTAVLLALTLANVAAIWVALQSIGRPRVSFHADVWHRYRAIWRDVSWSLLGAATWNIQSQGLTFLVASIGGPNAYAPIAAAVVLFSPLRPAISAIFNVFRPNFAAALASGRYRRVIVTMYSLCGLIVLACVAGGLAIWAGWPLFQIYVFAGKFNGATMPLIVFLTGLSVVIYSTYNVPLLVIQAAGKFKPIAVATSFGSVVSLVGAYLLLTTAGVAWSLAGLVAGEAVCAAYLWFAAHHILRARSAASHEPPVGASQARA